MLLGVLPESQGPFVALLWHGGIHGAEPQLGTGDREDGEAPGTPPPPLVLPHLGSQHQTKSWGPDWAMEMCWGHHLPSLFSSIQAFSIKQGLWGQVWVTGMCWGCHLPHLGSQHRAGAMGTRLSNGDVPAALQEQPARSPP